MRLAQTFLVLFCLPLFCGNVPAQAFQKQYADPGQRYLIANDGCESESAAFYITGEYRDNSAHAFLLKTTPDGLPLWCRKFQPTGPDLFFPSGWSVRPAPGGGALMSAWKEDEASVLGQTLVKTTPDGDLEWMRFAPGVKDKNPLATAGGDIYFGGYHRQLRKLYLSKLDQGGQLQWEKLYMAGDLDNYVIFSQKISGDDLILALGVEKLGSGGGTFGPQHSVLMRINQMGTLLDKVFFPEIFIMAIEPMADGSMAFLCRSAGIDWAGIGVMDAGFNWKWYKKIRLATGLLLKDEDDRQLALSGDETQLDCIFYVAGGGRIFLRFDPAGNLLAQQVYLSGLFGEKIHAFGAQDVLRTANIAADKFMFAKPEQDASLPNCPELQPCGLLFEDALLPWTPISAETFPFVCLEMETAIVTDLPVTVSDYCFDPGPMDAGFWSSDTLVCSGDPVQFERMSGNADVPFGLSAWRFESGVPPTGTGAEISNVRFDLPGLHSVQHIFNVAGCADTAFQIIDVRTAPIVALGADTTICAGDSLLLQAGPDLLPAYQWNTGETGNTAYADRSGVYAVSVTNSSGCRSVDAIRLTVLSPERVYLGPDTVFCQGSLIRIGPDSMAELEDYRWNTGQTGPFLDIGRAGTYILSVQNASCIFSDTLLVGAKDCPECRIYLPNTFAPEGAGANSVFQLFTDCGIQAQRMQIFDRWGNLVFVSSASDAAWDGMFKGKLQPPGVYVFYADLQLFSDNKPVEMRIVSGSVTLVR